jgi:hypothetical protein
MVHSITSSAVARSRVNLTSRRFELSNVQFNRDVETRSYVCGEQEYVL